MRYFFEDEKFHESSVSHRRILFGDFFLYNGLEHFRNRKPYRLYPVKNVPAPDAGVIVSRLMLLGGGASIILGLKTEVRRARRSSLPGLHVAIDARFLAAAGSEPADERADTVREESRVARRGMDTQGIEYPWPVSALKLRPRGRARVLEIVRKLGASKRRVLGARAAVNRVIAAA